jgi:hypothetical protein
MNVVELYILHLEKGLGSTHRCHLLVVMLVLGLWCI